MSAADVESIQSAGSPWIVPLLEDNLAKYTASLERNRRHQHQRKTHPDNCCRYCDVYRDDVLPQSKQHEIDVWRREVNLMLLQQHARARSASLSTTRSASASLRYAKQNYNAPGTPDTEPGFRRVRDIQSVNSRDGSAAKQRSLSAHGKRSLSRSVDLGSLPLGNNSKSANPALRQNCTDANERRHIGYAPPVSSLNTSKTPSNSSTSEGNMPGQAPQSCSNQLLNVTTIDDYLYRSNRDQTYTERRPFTANGSVVGSNRSKGHLSSRTTLQSGSARSTTVFQSQDARHGGNSPPKTSSTPRINKPIITDRSDIINVHQRLYNGSGPKHILHNPESTKPPPESKTFRRLHRNLHRWIDDELLKPKLHIKARLEAKNFQSAPESTEHYGKGRLSRKENPMHKSAPSLVADTPINYLRDPEHKESFLGMLIDMDKSTVDSNKTDLLKYE